MKRITEIREAIKACIDSVTGTGKVYAFERYTKDLKQLAALYVDEDGLLRGWHIRRVTTSRRDARANQVDGGRLEIVHTWQIRGFQAIVDADESEVAFDEIVEDVAAAFRADATLGGTVNNTAFIEQAGLQVTDSGPVMFAGVLCHSARCSLRTRHYE